MTKTDTSPMTVLVIATGLLALHLAFGWAWAAPASLGVGLAGIVSAPARRAIERVWMALARVLGFLVPNLLLSLIYLLVLLPLSLLSRLQRRDPLRLAASHPSYFAEVDREIAAGEFEKMW